MIILTDRMETTAGGIGKALEWAQRLYDHIQKSGLAPGQFWLIRPHTGRRNDMVAFVGEYDSVTEYDEFQKKMFADSGIVKLIEELRGSDWFKGTERIIYDVIKK